MPNLEDSAVLYTCMYVLFICYRKVMKPLHCIDCLGILFIAFAFSAKFEMNDHSRIISHSAYESLSKVWNE